jgi:hypothetical protein
MIIFELSEERLKEIINDAVQGALKKGLSIPQPEPPIKGIHELADFLRISPARAQKLKNENVFPYFQDGRTVLFDPAKVREIWQQFSSKMKK